MDKVIYAATGLVLGYVLGKVYGWWRCRLLAKAFGPFYELDDLIHSDWPTSILTGQLLGHHLEEAARRAKFRRPL